LIIGASDGALANLGTGATGTNLAVTIGTSGAARLIVKHSTVDKAMRTFCYHVKDDAFIIGGGNNNGAVVLQWLKEQLLETGDSYEDMLKLASGVPPGSSGLIMLPYILGERAPLWNADAKGVFFGITKQHRKAHFVRAAVEAVIFSMFSIAKILLEKNTVNAVYASGGFVKSELWLQVMADVFELPVHVSGASEASAYGAVILGAEALNIPCNFGNRIINSFYPSGENIRVYRQAFKKFERLYTLLEVEMSDNS
jgi:gluconokinase